MSGQDERPAFDPDPFGAPAEGLTEDAGQARTPTYPQGADRRGRKNVYQCPVCYGLVVTVDRDAGVTPMFINCRSTKGCAGVMRSNFYEVNQSLRATHEWYRPRSKRMGHLDAATRDHVEQGGLLLRPINTPDGALVLAPLRPRS